MRAGWNGAGAGGKADRGPGRQSSTCKSPGAEKSQTEAERKWKLVSGEVKLVSGEVKLGSGRGTGNIFGKWTGQDVLTGVLWGVREKEETRRTHSFLVPYFRGLKTEGKVL